MIQRFKIGLVLSLLFLSFPLHAYNFLYIHPTTGKPIGWDNTKTIQYWLDPGPLGRLTNDQAHTLLKEAMKIWENASPNANVPKFEFMGLLPEDVDGSNYQGYVSLGQCYADDLSSCPTEAQKILQTVIIFDNDNFILNNALCKITACGASSGAHVFSGSSQDPYNVIQGATVLGSDILIPLGTGSTQASDSINAAVGTMVHELGHLLGLAHTVVNQEIFINGSTDQYNLLPTMFSRRLDADAITLNPDDVVGISNLYPSDILSQNTGILQGQVLKSDGAPMMHVNVVTRNIEDPLCETYSFLSGRLCQHTYIGEYCLEENSEYTLSGLPSGSYSIEVEEVADDNLAFTLAPGLLPNEDIYGDAEFWNAGDQANEDYLLSDTISLSAGEMNQGINIVLNSNEVADERIKSIPLAHFIPTISELENGCQPNIVNYASMVGIEEATPQGVIRGNSSGCSLIP